MFLRDNDITDVIDESFTTTEDHFGSMVAIELKPGGDGIAVTEENKEEYVKLLVEHRIARRVREQFKAFMAGLNEIIPQHLIDVFDERELELLIGGISDIDVYVHLSIFFLVHLLSTCLNALHVKQHGCTPGRLVRSHRCGRAVSIIVLNTSCSTR